MTAKAKASAEAGKSIDDDGGGAAAAVLEAARELYGLPRDEFIAARTGRVKERRGAGDRAAASAIGKLAKPSLVAWAVNAAVRARPEDARELVDTVGAMQRSGAARDNATRHDELVQTLVDAAREALRAASEQASATRMASVAAAIRAASLARDPTEFLEGRLAREEASSDDTLEAALLAGSIAVARPRAESADNAAAGGREDAETPTNHGASGEDAHADAEARAKADAEAAAVAEAGAKRRRIRAELADAKQAARATKAAARDAERELKRAQRELERAQRTHDEAADSDQHAQQLVVELQAELDALD